MIDNDKLYENLDFYDKIIGSCMINTYSMSKDGKIILKDFNPLFKDHMFEFEVADMVSNIYNRQIYLSMPLFRYLSFKWKSRKRTKLKWISKNEATYFEFDFYQMLRHVALSYKQSYTIFRDIYNLYWKGDNNA